MSGLQAPFPPAAPASLQTAIGTYPYVEYADDPDIQAIFAAHNGIVQEYVTWFNTVGLPVYTGAPIVGPLLDWVCTGLYGLPRPIIPYGLRNVRGDFNTYTLNSIVFNGSKKIGGGTFYYTTDDIYKRCVTWQFYKGDGFQFCIPWLKRRIARFLLGTNGTAPPVADVSQISVAVSHGAMTITIGTTGILPLTQAPILQAAIQAGVLPLPFQYTYTVVL